MVVTAKAACWRRWPPPGVPTDHDVAGNGDLRRGKRLGIGEGAARARARGASATGTATSR
jgi:hypothetical protein